jgi:hypothetical protein
MNERQWRGVLSKTVLAENVTIRKDEGLGGEIEFDWLCPNCGKRHWATELLVDPETFDGVSFHLHCGSVSIRMPWHPTPQRDAESIYGMLPSGEPGTTHILGWK